MRKSLLFLMMILSIISYAQTAPALKVTITNTEDCMAKNSSYSGNLTVKGEGMTYTAYGFNNNNLGWGTNPLRCGSKSAAFVATFSTNSAVETAITKVELDIAVIKAGTNDKLNSLKLLVADDDEFAGCAEYDIDIASMPTATNATATLSVTVDAPAANKFYRLRFDCKKATNNGFLALNEVRYYGEGGGDVTTIAAPTITLGDDNMVTITAEAGTDIYYTTNGDAPGLTSTHYTAPFLITEETTVKAIATQGTKSSEVTTEVLTPNDLGGGSEDDAPYLKVDMTELKSMDSANQYTATVNITGIDDDMDYQAYGFSNNNKGWNTNPLRCGNKNAATDGYVATFSTKAAVDAKITKVELDVTVIKAGTNDKLNSLKLLVADNDQFADATEYDVDITEMPTTTNTAATFTVNVTAPAADKYYRLAFDCKKATNNGFLALDAVRYYGEKEAGTLAAPKIELGENNTVTITADAGLAIYYTTNGDAPTTASTPYTAPFTISGVTTVKAIASDGSKTSSVATSVLTPNTVASIAEFIDLSSTKDVKINAPLTAIYQNGRNLYVKDSEDSFILIYNANNVEGIAGEFATNGDVMSYATGTFKSQNGLPELIPSALGEKSTGTAVEPETLAIEEIGTDMLNKYVRIENVNITAAEKANNYEATDDTGTIVLYNTFYNSSYYDVVEVPEGEGFTVIGFVGCYNSTMQITPISITGGTALETVATPVIAPASGSKLNAGDEITITCATEGATIYYTNNGENPTTESPLYTGSILFDGTSMTVKAFAVKDGMLDSEMATANYSLLVEGQNTATFNFAEPSTLSPAPETPTSSNTQIKLNTKNRNNVFTDGSITLTFGDGENTNNSPVIIYPTAQGLVGKLEARIYKNNTMTFSATDANISTITFNQQEGSTNWADFTFADGLGEFDTTHKFTVADNDITEVIFTSIGTTRFTSIDVDYMPKNTAIDGIAIDNDDNAPVEYFNLQGMPVKADNLTPGIYIRRQGSKAGKVLVK